jgi:hypothetical protein
MNSLHSVPLLLLATAVCAQSPALPTSARPHVDGPRAAELQARFAGALPHVVHDDGATSTWSLGATWKAGFAADGFTYVPAFGAGAERNHPVHFRLARLTVAGEPLAFAPAALPQRHGDRVVFDRGGVRELYDLALERVEQSFVLDAAPAGDIALELEVTTDLLEDAARPGLQFGNALGAVHYGEAFLVVGHERRALATTFASGRLRIHVPAALRGDGPVVIDPILNTEIWDLAASGRDLDFPDISYDASHDQYCVVWERVWSRTDSDILCQSFDGDGEPVPGSLGVVDATSSPYRQPRIANVADGDTFLIVMEAFDPAQWGSHTQIVARMRSAGTHLLGGLFAVSEPASMATATTPDVGGDPSVPLAGRGFCVVWTQSVGTGSRIFYRSIRPDGVLASVLVLDTTPTPGQYSPQISHGNGNGQVPHPAWFVVWSEPAATGIDVVGKAIGVDGRSVQRVAIAQGTDDRYPFVSSPATDGARTEAWFLVTWERQNPSRSLAAVYSHRTRTATSTFDLTPHGCGAYWVRSESDGTRFVVATSMGTTAGTIGLSTLAWTGSSFAVHESQQFLTGLAAFPMLVANRNGGGRATEYGIAYTNETLVPSRIGIVRYRGHAPGNQITVRPYACGGLALGWTGAPLFGATMDFRVVGNGNDIPAIAVGFPANTPNVPCPPCQIGLRHDLPIVLHLPAPTLSFVIPGEPRLLGISLGVQGFAFGQGACLSGLRTTELLDLALR